MKKFLFGIICVLAFAFMAYDIGDYEAEAPILASEDKGYRESFNSPENMHLARRIAAMTTAERVAVIGNEDGVLIGIALKPGTGNRSALRGSAEKLAKKYYKDEKIIIEIQNDKSEKIFSLASYLEKGIPENILSQRISYLLEH